MAALEVCSLEDEVDYGIESDHDDAPAAAPASSAPPADDAEAAAPAAAAADAGDDGAAAGDAAAAADAPSERKNGKAKEKPSSPRDGKDKDKKRDKDKKADAPALKTREVRRCFRDAVLDVVNGPNAPRFPFNASLVADRMRRRWPQFSAAKTEYGKFTGLVEAMAADGVVTAKASTGSGANNGGGLQITAVKGARDRSPRARRSRSRSRDRKRSASPKRKRSASPKRKRSASPKRKRSASPKRKRSASPKRKDRKRSPSPKRTRSASPAKNGRSDGARRSPSPAPRGGRDGGGSKKPRIHFAFFTSAPPADAGLAKDILAHLEGLRDVALDARDAKPPRDDKEYRDRELARIRDAAALVAEVSNASIGVGYKIAAAEALGKKILCLHAAAKHPSRLLRSNPDLTLAPYATIGDARKAVAAFLRRL